MAVVVRKRLRIIFPDVAAPGAHFKVRRPRKRGSRSPARLAKFESLESAALSPAVYVGEIALRAGRVAKREAFLLAISLPFIVVIARCAFGAPDPRARPGHQEFDPLLLRLGARLDLRIAFLLRMADYSRHRICMVDQIVRIVGDEGSRLVLLDEKQVREAMDMQPMQSPHPILPVIGQLHPVATGHIIARARDEIGAHLEPRCIDDAIDLIFHAARDHALFGDPLHALAVSVDQLGRRAVEGLEVFVMEARAFA